MLYALPQVDWVLASKPILDQYIFMHSKKTIEKLATKPLQRRSGCCVIHLCGNCFDWRYHAQNYLSESLRLYTFMTLNSYQLL